MIVEPVIIPKGIHNILRKLTGQSRPDIALSLAIKELVRLSMKESKAQIESFESKYGMSFAEFEKACDDGRIKDPFSYEVEKDDFEWEAAITDLASLEEMSQWIV
ncbi:MAG: hypothetical protein PHQ36_12480 [Anaerolineales bacterium]|nr:hypothetical protein [Anaerolineales bacterium]